MKRLAPLAVFCALALATTPTAGAQTLKLTVHQAKHAIRHGYLYADPDARPSRVTVGHCQRHSPTDLTCQVTVKLYSTCFRTERWDATNNSVIQSAAPHMRAYGKCPSITITPTDGAPTYLPPSTDGPTG